MGKDDAILALIRGSFDRYEPENPESLAIEYETRSETTTEEGERTDSLIKSISAYRRFFSPKYK